jgi:aminomuconate-semialdehyde/2-hydroxymuconate-6-semialdehyde dehydrogenase
MSEPEEQDVIELANLIGGELQPANCGHWVDDIAPATGRLIARIPCSDSTDIDQAVAAARQALPGWAALDICERADYLDQIADALEERSEELAALESLDTGKPITLAREVDAARSVSNFRFFAKIAREFESETFEMSDALNHVVYKPVGVAGLITPWNLPLYLLSWKVAPAIVMGNTVVAKPSELSPLTASLLADIIQETDLPDGVFNLIHGTGPHAGAALVEHPDVDLISFTGGTETGSTVAASAAPAFKKLSLELGGKNASIVFADSDADKTIPGVLRAAFLNQGQVCLCGSRILIERSIYPEFREEFLQAVQEMVLGDPFDPETELGALISPEHLAKVTSYIELAGIEGGVILCGGEAPGDIPEEFSAGNWLMPTVIEGVSHDSRTATEEIFGPVVTLHPFDDEEEAITMANCTQYGLAGSVWTEDLVKGERIAAAIDSGMVWVNCWLHRDLRVPFGGVKQSGVGLEGGRWSLDFYSEAMNICVKHD